MDDSTKLLYKLRLAHKLKEPLTGTAKEMSTKLRKIFHESVYEALGKYNVKGIIDNGKTGGMRGLKIKSVF